LQRRDVAYSQNNTINIRDQQCKIRINQPAFEQMAFKIKWIDHKAVKGHLGISIQSDEYLQKQTIDVSKRRSNVYNSTIKFNVPRIN
jgi:hypothetical protein